MAYTFLVSDGNAVNATNKETIMQRSKLVNDIWFLVNPEYFEQDMELFNVVLEYVLPVSRKYCTMSLIKDEAGYNGYLKYVVPVDTNLSSEAGDVEIQLTFVYTGITPDGQPEQKVRKTKVGKIHVTPIAAWSDLIPDEALSALDQRIIKIDAEIKHLSDVNDTIVKTKADNLRYYEDDNMLTLMADGKEIGDKVKLKNNGGGGGGIDEDGVPVIDFNKPNTDPEPEPEPEPDDECENDVVEF